LHLVAVAEAVAVGVGVEGVGAGGVDLSPSSRPSPSVSASFGSVPRSTSSPSVRPSPSVSRGRGGSVPSLSSLLAVGEAVVVGVGVEGSVRADVVDLVAVVRPSSSVSASLGSVPRC
jgi:hypothetical protein